MMTPIVERKKKGRPSKADLARRAGASEQESEVRRHVRRRRARYTLDVDDLIDELDGEEEDERRKEKKLKQLLKLQNNESGSESAPNRNRRVEDAPADSASSSGGEDGDRPLKKRKIDGGDEIDGDDEHEEVRRRKAGSKVADSVPGTPSDPMVELPLPEKKSLELILDKLQKKDTYGVYAEPVDPDELPDYHDVIEHPMDFATVRKKLGNGLYSTLEQFEDDIYLICTNAMQYNAPDTVYYKQAHSIQELAKKNFQELRIDVEHYEKELKSGQNPRSNSSAKQQMKKPTSTTLQEPVGSDFSSGATLATTWDFQNGLNATRDGGFERLTNVDGPVGENTSLVDNNYVKAKDLQGRVPLSRFGRKAFTDDDNRRATYSISNKPLVGSESIFTTFDGEVKQLVAVGIHADHSYARSLALFAATLGPVAWKVASGRIEEALPRGFKYGRGWVGDYEPLSTPILMLENCSPKEPVFVSKTNGNSNPRKNDKTSNPLPIQNHPISFSSSQGKPSLVSAAVTKPAASTAESVVVSSKEPLEGKLPFFSSGRTAPTTSGNVNHQLRAAVTKPTESTAESAVVSAKEPLEVKQPFFSSGRTPPTTSANVNHQLRAAVIIPSNSTESAMVSANEPLEGKHPFFSSGRTAPTTAANVSHQLRAAVTKPTNSTAESAVVSANEPLEGKQPFFSSGRTAPTTSADVNHRPRAAVTKATNSSAEGAVVSANEPLEGKQPFFSSGRTVPTMSADVNHRPRAAVTKAANSTAESVMVSANEPLEWKPPFFSSAKTAHTSSANVNQQLRAAVTRPTDSTAERAMVSGKEPLEGKQPFFSSGTTPTTSANVNHQLQSPRSKSNNDSGKKVVKQLELNCSPFSANQNTGNFVSENLISNDLYMPASHSTENVSRNRNHMQSLPLKQPENHGYFAGGLPNGKLISNSLNRNAIVFSSDSTPKQMVASATYIPHGPEQGLTDPVQLMRMLAENAEKQQEMINYSPLYNLSVMPPVPSSRRDDSNNASAAAAQAWMSVGSGMSTPASVNTSGHSYPIFTDSLYNNTTRELQQRVSQHQGDFSIPGMHLQPVQNGFPFQAYGIPPVRMGNEDRFQNNRGMNFPPSVADLSRFQVQSPRQGLNSQRQPRQQQESLPPDLNNVFQSSGSPVGQSSGVLLDSQYPDLALQL